MQGGKIFFHRLAYIGFCDEIEIFKSAFGKGEGKELFVLREDDVSERLEKSEVDGYA